VKKSVATIDVGSHRYRRLGGKSALEAAAVTPVASPQTHEYLSPPNLARHRSHGPRHASLVYSEHVFLQLACDDYCLTRSGLG